MKLTSLKMCAPAVFAILFCGVLPQVILAESMDLSTEFPFICQETNGYTIGIVFSSIQASIYTQAYEDLVEPLAALKRSDEHIYNQYIEALSWQDLGQIEALIRESAELTQYIEIRDSILTERDVQLFTAKADYSAQLEGCF